jgi:hypothetical protein
MIPRQISDPVDFFATFSLHDVEIGRIECDIDEEKVTLFVDDFNANYAETPEYEGCRPCALLFQGVAKILIDVETYEGIRISHAAVVQAPPLLRLELDLNLGGGELTRGRHSVVITFKSLHLKDLPLH